MEERSIFLTFDEVRVLLYALGVREIEGVYMPEKEFGEEEVIKILWHLTDSGLIHEEDGAFVMREDVRRILEIMGHPSGTFVIESGPAEPRYFCYAVPGEAVVSEQCVHKKDTLRLRSFQTAEFEEWKERIAE